MPKKEAFNVFLVLGMFFVLLAIAYFFFGNFINYKQSVTGFQSQSDNGVAQLNPPQETDVGGGSGGSSSSSQRSVGSLSSSSPMIRFADVDFSVSLEGGEISKNNPIRVSKPEVDGGVVANHLASFKSFLSVPVKVNGQIKVGLPSGARYVRVIGADNSAVSVGTNKFFGGISDAFNVGASKGSDVISINNPEAGNYQISFSANTPYVSQVETKKNGDLSVLVSNPSKLGYSGVDVYTEINPSEINVKYDVVSNDGKKSPAEVFDSNGDGKPDVMKFSADLPPESERQFFAKEVKSENVVVKKFEGGVSLSPTIPTSISSECEGSLAEVRSSGCNFDIQSGEVLRGDISGAVQKTYYTFDNPDCPNDFVRSDYCALDKSQNLYVVPASVAESPAESQSQVDAGQQKYMRAVSIVNRETKKTVAFVSYDAVKNKLDIVF